MADVTGTIYGGNTMTGTLGVVYGKDGYTPVRGVDYWTDEDKAEIESYIDDRVSGAILEATVE